MEENQRNEFPRFFTGRIAAWSRRHRRLVLVGWLIIALLLVGSCFNIAADEDLDEEGTGDSAEAAWPSRSAIRWSKA